MAEINGRCTVCDRCGTKIFRKCIGEGEADGGWTRWNEFEPLPEGWNFAAIPKECDANWKGGNAYNNYIQVCPDCYNLWKTIINESFLSGTPYYHVDEGE